MKGISSGNTFLLSVGALLVFGLVMLSSASAVLSYQRTGDGYFYFKQQLVSGVLPGLALFAVAAFFPYRRLKPLALPFILVCITLLALLFLPQFGITANGATRWFDAGVFSFQPSEAFKLAFIIYLAALFESHRERFAAARYALVTFLVLAGIVFFLLAKQPDLGTLGVIALTAYAVYFAAGARITHLLLLGVIGLVALATFIYSAGYELDRLTVYLNPQTDTQNTGYQMHRAMTAIETGGVFGLGFGQSQRKMSGYLPEPMGDSVFAVVAEELGFVGVGIAVALFAFLGWQGFGVAARAPDIFGRLIATGVTSWVLVQALVNIGAISGLLPLTGIPLPFISYGGTSLVVLLTACGIVYNIQRASS